MFCDVSTLETLPLDELNNGLVETLKHALIVDRDFFNQLDAMLDKLTQGHALSTEELTVLVHRSCKIKCDIVALDEYESQGERQWLNLGHTVAHAIEKQLDYQVSHGQAVWVGLWVSSYLAHALHYLSESDFSQIKSTLNKIQYQKPIKMIPEHIILLQQHMLLDKKSVNKQARFVVLNQIGVARSENGIYSFPVDSGIVTQALTSWIEEQV